MSSLKLSVLVVVSMLLGAKAMAQEVSGSFIPSIFWDANVDKGILLISPDKMEIFDRKGAAYGEITAKGQVLNVYMSPDGKKLVYSTATGLWMVKLDTKTTSALASGFCNYFSWDGAGTSFTFAIYAKTEGTGANAYNIRLFWADGDGKNLKQVYP
ncbi:MAG: hypothetical protein HY952_09980 [Elusimicrobia bacterium]|nr:hypothetical protein [Elusimicrobiota bacterium]